MSTFIFFTLNDFKKDGGGTIRMRGIINALAKAEKDVILLSNAKNDEMFHSNIKHISLDVVFSKKEKRVFQFLCALFPPFIVYILFKKKILHLECVLKKQRLLLKSMISFEHLDNSIVYLLKKRGTLSAYITDTHGIAPMEFLYKSHSKLFNYMKYLIAERLDRKVLFESKGSIFLSNAMKSYFETRYPYIKTKKHCIVRDGLSTEFCSKKSDKKRVEEYRQQYKLLPQHRVVMFAGNFKDLGGVLDLLSAFKIVVERENILDIKLILIGSGEDYIKAVEFVQQYKLEEKVVFTGNIPYSELRNYQELADVIVCPDKQHPFSELVPHIKYFDSLASGKVVINGSFRAIREINQNECLSVDFEPSNIEDLADKIELVLKNIDKYEKKYIQNRDIICSQFTYEKFVKEMIKEEGMCSSIG